jgi:hypothetical protein
MNLLRFGGKAWVGTDPFPALPGSKGSVKTPDVPYAFYVFVAVQVGKILRELP